MLEPIKKPGQGSWLNKGQSKLSKNKKIVYSALLSIAIAALAVSIYLATRPAEVLIPPGYTPITPQTECQQLEAQVNDLIAQANYCQTNSDCQVISLLTCPFGCYPLLNKQADIADILQQIEQYKRDCQPLCEYECPPTAPELTDIKCLNGKCVDTRFEVDQQAVDEVSIATDKTIYSQGEEVKITTQNNSSDKAVYLLPPFEYIEKIGKERWWDLNSVEQCPCGSKCEPKFFEKIEPNQKKITAWDQKIGKPCQLENAVLSIYRICVHYSFGDPTIKGQSLTSQKVCSNGFEIKAKVSQTDGLILDPYQYVWEEKEGKYGGGMRRFFLDLNDDRIPELFLGVNMLFGNAGGPYHIFSLMSTGWQYLGEVNLHEKAIWLVTTARLYGFKNIRAYWRVGIMVEYTYDSSKYVLISKENVSNEDVPFDDALSVKIEYSSSTLPTLQWAP